MNKTENFNYIYFDFRFHSPIELSGPEEIGPRDNRHSVVEFNVPDKTDSGKIPRFRLVMFRVPKGLKHGPLSKTASYTDKLSYCNTVYLGAGPANLKMKRKYKGREISGHMKESSIPRKGVKESYILGFEGAFDLFVGFSYLDGYSSKDSNSIIQAFFKSISIGQKSGNASFPDHFRDEYRITPKVEEIKASSKEDFRLDSEGLERVKSYRFKAKKHIKGKKGFYLQFRYSVFEYKKTGQAEEVFSRFTKKQKQIEDYMRSKSPMLVLLKDSCVCVLDGSCLYSKENMNAIERKLILSIFSNQKPNEKAYLKRICGGNFVKLSR